MTDGTLAVKDGTGAAQTLKVQVNGDASLTSYRVEDTTQRAALLTAIGLLGTHADLVSILTKLTADPATQTTLAAILTKLNASIALSAGESFVGLSGGVTAIKGGSFTRPADTTAYALGDLVANNTVAGSVVPITVNAGRVTNGTGMARRVRLKKTSTSLANASFRVHLYKDSPTCANGDNAAWSTTESNYLGACDVTMDEAFTDGAKGIGVPNAGGEINFDCSSGTANIFALIEARAAYAPASGETFSLSVEVLQN